MVPPHMAAIGDEEDNDTPPGDDCCPICFGSYTVPCKTNCGHWFCANCILMFWNYRNALQRCKCPICSSLISKLTPETSLALRQDMEVVEALKKVKKYNCLFVGGAYGLVMKVQQLPLLCTAMCRGLLNPDRLRENYVAVRLIALLLTGLYKICGFEFMHKDFLGVRFAIEIPALVVVLLLCIVGICRRRLRMPHRVRLVG